MDFSKYISDKAQAIASEFDTLPRQYTADNIQMSEIMTSCPRRNRAENLYFLSQFLIWKPSSGSLTEKLLSPRHAGL